MNFGKKIIAIVFIATISLSLFVDLAEQLVLELFSTKSSTNIKWTESAVKSRGAKFLET